MGFLIVLPEGSSLDHIGRTPHHQPYICLQLWFHCLEFVAQDKNPNQLLWLFNENNINNFQAMPISIMHIKLPKLYTDTNYSYFILLFKTILTLNILWSYASSLPSSSRCCPPIFPVSKNKQTRTTQIPQNQENK